MSKEDLKNAKKDKADEFYTQLVDIELELKNYKNYFKNKVVFCNCDDPYESNFFKYFAINFNYLGLKKLIATCYDNSPVAYTQMSFYGTNKEVANRSRHPYKIIINEVEDYNKDGAIDLSDVDYLLKNKNNVMTLLEGNGDFRSEECIELLQESDVVVTNPPFSLFREYVGQLINYNKKFIIIGNQNAITYKEIFKLIKENKIWLGKSIHSGDREFRVPSTYQIRSKSLRIDELGNRYIRVVGIRWWTNIDYKERHEDLVLYKRYTPQEYPTFVNYNAINVNKTCDIPYDYDGYIGVPITFLDKYNPDQFEIVGQGQGNLYRELTTKGLPQSFVDDYYKFGGKGSIKEDHPVLAYYNNDGKPIIPYMRIIIKRRRKNEN